MDSRPSVIRLAVFGKPVSQSLSPCIHNLFAQQLGLHLDYQAIEATPDAFPRQLRELISIGGRGCNVTVPLKQVAWELAACSSDSAARARAANTLVFDDEIFADNTDGRGLVDDLARVPNGQVEGARICLLGAGGAAAGILAALLRAGPEYVLIANRTTARARTLAERHADLGRVETCAPGEIGANGPFDLLINATSHGHHGQAPALAADWFSSEGLCYDLNYGTAAAPLKQVCKGQGIAYADGLGMLVAQAALSFALWTGKLPDVAPVLAQLR